ncbi:MAG: shikimate kinase, partial [Thermoprotei archaeon]
FKMSHTDVLTLNTTASIRAGVSYTGALDDAAACLLGGVAVTDYTRGLVLRRYDARREKAVFLVPHGLLRPDVVKKLSSNMRCSLTTAHRLALVGRYHEALNLNGAVYAYAYGYPNQPIVDAWRLGASAAGITGNGPACAALAEDEVAEQIARRWSGYGRVIVTETRNGGDP